MAEYNLVCPVCRKAFAARRVDAQTCSNTCKVKRWRRAEREELNALRRRLADLEEN